MPQLHLVRRRREAREKGVVLSSIGDLLFHIRDATPESPRRIRLTFSAESNPKRAHYLWDLHDRRVIILDEQSLVDLRSATSRHDWAFHPDRDFSFSVERMLMPFTLMSFVGKFGGTSRQSAAGDIERIERLQAGPT